MKNPNDEGQFNFTVPDDIKDTLSSAQGQKIMDTINHLDDKTKEKLTKMANSMDKSMLGDMLKNNAQVKAALSSPDLLENIKKLLGE